MFKDQYETNINEYSKGNNDKKNNKTINNVINHINSKTKQPSFIRVTANYYTDEEPEWTFNK